MIFSLFQCMKTDGQAKVVGPRQHDSQNRKVKTGLPRNIQYFIIKYNHFALKLILYIMSITVKWKANTVC